jgi:hypothetical protein
MLKYLLCITLTTAVAVSIGYAQKPSSSVIIPVTRTPASNGKAMYINYCAPCHGVDGRGNGPAAAALKTRPVDLTMLSMNNHGQYPMKHVIGVLQFGTSISAHGSAEMPMWGPVLGDLSPTDPSGEFLRIRNLARYIETVQAK